MSDEVQDQSVTEWISRGFEHLEKKAHDFEAKASPPGSALFDVLIVGSGYGGSIAADTFSRCLHKDNAGSPVSVCVLERGREYLPGAFPANFGELPAHVRTAAVGEGLFDIRPGPEVSTVIANGVGGGSLINAGVMEVPRERVFNEHWPKALRGRALHEYFARAKFLLGATTTPHQDGEQRDNTIAGSPDGVPQKFSALQSFGQAYLDQSRTRPDGFRAAAITIAVDDTINTGGVNLDRCISCGDCALGCNHGAKDSLDTNLLVRARDNGAEIYSGATVTHIARDADNDVWIASVVYTNGQLKARQASPCKIRAKRVILAAGTLGSTEILLRSQAKRSGSEKRKGQARRQGRARPGLEAPTFSRQLGQRCSTNGDMLAVDYRTGKDHGKPPVHAVADAADRPSKRRVGPTITGIVDIRERAGLTIEELAIPAALRRAFAEIFATTNVLHRLAECDRTTHKRGFPDDDGYVIDPDVLENSAIFAVMGDDGALGQIELSRDEQDGGAGSATIRWPNGQFHPVFDRQIATLQEMAKLAGSKGRLLGNPLWNPLPESMSWLTSDGRGPVLTVHPLGGCAMADDSGHGVVNDLGQVFDADGGIHDGLVVLDGSIVPTALETNPALTIAAVSLRACESLAARVWNFELKEHKAKHVGTERPRFRKEEVVDAAFEPEPTEIQVIERMHGEVWIRTGLTLRRCAVELTVAFESISLKALSTAPHGGVQPVMRVARPEDLDSKDVKSKLRIFEAEDYRQLRKRQRPSRISEPALDDLALFVAPVIAGEAEVFKRQPSSAPGRIARALWAYFVNRGMRDWYQLWRKPRPGQPSGLRRFGDGIRLASRSGEVRTLDYNLRLGKPVRNSLGLRLGPVRGRKRFTYALRSNPLRQLMELSLVTCPGLVRFPGWLRRKWRPTLSLDPSYLARIGVPLFQITKEADGATALAELGSFLGYFLRLLLGIHMWTFRLPDEKSTSPRPGRLPGRIPKPAPETGKSDPNGGWLMPEVHELFVGTERPELDAKAEPLPVYIRLSRYRHPEARSDLNPIVMIHGYSASGTTFAHPSVSGCFVQHYWARKRDVWVLDLRSSAGMPTAHKAWSFEQMARRDIPLAFAHVFRVTGKKVDVIAHCMGAAMFSMAVLSACDQGLEDETLQQLRMRYALVDTVARAAFSQVGPLMLFSPANIFRAYALRYLREYLPDNYTFDPGSDPGLTDQLLDRFLACVPYPDEEFKIENPRWPTARTEWVRTRHRMDALYGRTFNLVNMEPEVLEHIDDFFGPISIETLTQTLHFSRFGMITNRLGENQYVSRKRFESLWHFPTLSIHGTENGLSDLSTLDRMLHVMTDAGRDHKQEEVEGAGHQDCIIGKPRDEVLRHIDEFFGETEDVASRGKQQQANEEFFAYAPWIGPIVTYERGGPTIRLGSRPTHRVAEAIVMLRVAVDEETLKIVRPDDPTLDWDVGYIKSNMSWVTGPVFRSADRWHAFKYPLRLRDASNGTGLLVTVVYAEAPQLNEDTQGEFRVLANPRTLFFGDVAEHIDESTGETDRSQGLNKDTQERMARAVLGRLLDSNTQAPAMAQIIDDEDRELFDGYIPDRLTIGRDRASEGAREDEQLPAFALISCQYPGAFFDRQVAYETFERLRENITQAEGGAEFIILTGDQVYVDPTAGLYDPSSLDDRYRIPYERWLRNDHVRNVLRRAPSFMLLDDHELNENWEPATGENVVELGAKGIRAYKKFQRGIEFAHDVAGHNDPASELRSDLSFEFVRTYPFFMLNTRSCRKGRNAANVGQAELFDATTLERLEHWLGADCDTPRFIVTPAMLFPRHTRAALNPLHSDGWDGYPATFHRVLAMIADLGVENLVFLSGDEHRPFVAEIELTRDASSKAVRLLSIHTSAAFAPYPFANALPEDLLLNETHRFRLDDGGPEYRCTVRAEVPSQRDGYTWIRPYRDDAGRWVLAFSFREGRVDSRRLG